MVSASVARCRRALHKHTTHPARSTARARTARARTAGARNASMGGASTHNASMHSASTKHGPAHPRDVDDVDGRRPHDVDDRYTRLSQAHHGVRSVKRTAAGSAVPRPCLPSLAAVGRRRLGAVCVALALANCAGSEEHRGRVLWDATSRGLCGPVGPPRTNVRVVVP